MKPTMPVFVFARRRDIELETGLLLAGQLVIDLPKSKEPSRREQRMIKEIVERLSIACSRGELLDMACGWRGGSRPANAVDVKDDALMTAWAADRLVIALRIDARPNDGTVRLDSDLLRQMGLVQEH